MDNPEKPLHDLLDRQQSSFSKRLIQLCCHKETHGKSFIPHIIILHNTIYLSDKEPSARFFSTGYLVNSKEFPKYASSHKPPLHHNYKSVQFKRYGINKAFLISSSVE